MNMQTQPTITLWNETPHNENYENQDDTKFKDVENDINRILDKTAALHKHRIQLDSEKAKQEFEVAQAEWDSIDGVVPEGVKLPSSAASEIECTPLTDFSTGLNYFKNTDMTQYLENIVPVVERSRVSSVIRYVFGPPQLISSLESDRDLIFAIASCPLKNEEPVHLQVLQTIYKQLTDSKKDCPRYGPHWELIGFQGNDPGTDLRGVGFLALIHLLYMVTNPATLPLAKAILKLSHHPTQNFPFAVMGINMTRIVLQTLREEKLNRELNKRRDVMGITNEFYVGVFLHVYEAWVKEKVTIEHSGWVLKGTENLAKKKPRLILRELDRYLKTHTPSAPEDAISVCSFLTPPPVPTATDTTPRLSHMEPFPIRPSDTTDSFSSLSLKPPNGGVKEQINHRADAKNAVVQRPPMRKQSDQQSFDEELFI